MEIVAIELDKRYAKLLWHMLCISSNSPEQGNKAIAEKHQRNESTNIFFLKISLVKITKFTINLKLLYLKWENKSTSENVALSYQLHKKTKDDTTVFLHSKIYGDHLHYLQAVWTSSRQHFIGIIRCFDGCF